jgi:hypothetical protein
MEIKHEDEAVCIDTNGLVVSGDVAIRVYKFRTQMPIQEMRPMLGVHASSCQYGLNKGAQICFIQYHTFFTQGVCCAPYEHFATVFSAPSHVAGEKLPTARVPSWRKPLTLVVSLRTGIFLFRG